MSAGVPPAKVAVFLGLCVFMFISFTLYTFVDSNAAARSSLLNQNGGSVDLLKAKVKELQNKLNHNEVIVKDLNNRLNAYNVHQPDVKDGNNEPNIGNNEPKQIPQPKDIPAGGESVVKNIVNSQQCPNTNAKSDIQMLDVYDELKFDNPDGGVWKQGFDIKYDKKKVQEEKKLEVVVIPHSHCDPGWLQTFEGYYKAQTKNILDGMATNLAEKPDMKFIYAEMSFFELWWSEQSESTKEAVKGFLKSGQLEIVTGGWVMTDEANAHLYSMVMELFEGHEFLDTQMNYKPRSHWSIDPFGLSSVLAQVTKSANLTHMAVQRVHYSVKRYLAERKQLEFRWRQLYAGDSPRTDIRTHMFPFYSYDVPHTCGPDPSVCCTFDFKRLSAHGCPWDKQPKRINSKNVASRAEMLYDQYRKKAQLYGLNVLLVPLGDDFRYDTEVEWTEQYENYKKLFEYMNSKSDWNVHARFGTLADYFKLMDERLAEETDTDKQDLPILSGDFFTYADRDDHYWSGYFTSRPFYKHMDRSVGHYVRAADVTYSLAVWKAKTNNDLPEALKQAYNRLVDARRAMSLFQHHDGVTGTARDSVVIDYGKKMLEAIEDCKAIIQQSTAYLLKLPSSAGLTVDTKHYLDKLPENIEVDIGNVIILQNSLAFKRSEVNCITVTSNKAKVTKSDSSEVKQQIQPVVKVTNGKISVVEGMFELCFVAEVPALGAAKYSVEEGDQVEMVKIEGSSGVDLSAFPSANTVQGSEVLLSNAAVTASFDAGTGMLRSIKTRNGETVEMNMEFVHYGARGRHWTKNQGGDSLSGAYLFLPDGNAKPLAQHNNKFIKMAGPVRSSLLIQGLQEAQLLQEIRLDDNTEYLEIINSVNITTQSNFELAMRIKSKDFADNDEFYTDLNGQQMIRRKRYEKLPIQAQFYPMPGAAMLQTKTKKWSVLGRQALGVASLEPGWMEIMLDRRLDQDDDRGLVQGVQDNKRTESRFRLLVEPTQLTAPESTRKLGFLSLQGHQSSLTLHYPLITMVTKEEATNSLPDTYSPLKKSLPCDVHILALRNYGEKTTYSSSGKSTVPKNEAALILQRLGVECGESRVGGDCEVYNGKLDITEYFADTPTRLNPTSLTNLDQQESKTPHLVQLEPYDLKTISIKY
ncbi:unnamed protein product [Bursaphelenchus okinawaensis]|uniref:Alpha-mannosidase n=1 Tax=Bursaphelenchus okinawaensis TaxID=465554 RepID=A0A811L3B1_9BILA|nr:unnamed protein product [Bursaphelenchus okinawaensis]CAG9118279.1 unnamed protein product [Bursaphelenchus okinawaensis]